MSLVLALLSCIVLRYAYSSGPILNPRINQTSNGSWSITAYEIGVDSVWFQDDLHQLLYLTAGDYHNAYFLDAFYFNSSGHIEIVKANTSSNLHHDYQCLYSPQCDYHCEVDGYNTSYLQYSGQYQLLSPQFGVGTQVYSYIGPALDALGILPVIVYASNATDNTQTLLYRGMDLLMSFGGLGRYYFPGKLYNVPPNYDTMKELMQSLGCPQFHDVVTNVSNTYNQPQLDMNQYLSMMASGKYVNERSDIFGDAFYTINDSEHSLNLTIVASDYYASYVYNATMGVVCLDAVQRDNCSYVDMGYSQLLKGLSGYPSAIAYNGQYLIMEHEFATDSAGKTVDVFSGTAVFLDGSMRPLIKYFDSASHLLLGMDIINEGISFNQPYDFTKTGYQRIWFDQTSAILASSFVSN